MFIIKKKAEETVAQLTFHGYSGNDIREDIVGSYIFEAFDSHKIGDYKKLLEKARLYVRFNLIGKTVGDMCVDDVYAMLDYNPNNEVHQAMLRALNTIIIEVCKVDKSASVLSLMAGMFFNQI
jgi:hypothetical protein